VNRHFLLCQIVDAICILETALKINESISRVIINNFFCVSVEMQAFEGK
jgi:hypothetical protein